LSTPAAPAAKQVAVANYLILDLQYEVVLRINGVDIIERIEGIGHSFLIMINWLSPWMRGTKRAVLRL